MSIFGNIFRGNDLEDKKQEYERIEADYQRKGEAISRDSISLFEHRKESVRRLLRVKSYIDGLNNCPKDITRDIEKALAYAEDFRKTMRWETEAKQGLKNSSSYKKSSSSANGVNIGIGGMATGAAIATMGPTAAMAIATTFGTASTGAAISSLGGIAATNAALAWLGGGAVAAGGAGIAGGSALLALAGPIGWGLAGVAALGTSYKMRSSNTRAIEELDKLIKKIKGKLNILKPKHQKLRRLIDETKKLNGVIDLDMFLNCPQDYTLEEYPKDKLINLVNTCKTIGKLLNETVEMKM